MPTLFIPVGIPGCGKSTLADALGAQVVSSDAIRESLGDVTDQSKNDLVFKTFHSQINTFLRGAQSVFADATNLDYRARTVLRTIADGVTLDADAGDPDLHAHGLMFPVRTHLILFRNPIQALHRNRIRDRVVPDDVMMRMLTKYERAVTDIANENYDQVTEISSVR